MAVKRYFSLVIFVFFNFSLCAQTHIWTGNGGDVDWFNAGNWNLGTIPSSTSDVLISDGFSVEIVSSNASVNSIEFDGVVALHIENDLQLVGTWTISSNSQVLWLKGIISGGGLISNDGTILIESQEEKELINISVNNHGSLFFTNTNITRISNATVINNTSNGIIEINSVGGWTQNDLGNTLNNEGIIRKIRNGSGLSTFYLIMDINNSGVIEVEEEQTFLILGNSILLNNQVSGILSGSGTFDITANFENSGTFSPGESGIGTLGITNYFSFPPEATLQLDVAGSNLGEFDMVDIFGFPELEGTINVNLSYEPEIGEIFIILTANSITSCNLPEFISTSYNGLDYNFRVICNPTNVTLEVVDSTIGINELSTGKIDFNLYPNPSSTSLQFVYPFELIQNYTDISIIVCGTVGNEIARIPVNSKETFLDVSNIPSGMYLTYLIAKNEFLATSKMLVK